ncbi:MAG: hypothetical protein ACYDCH_02765 [Gaiellaceae bacterium]
MSDPEDEREEPAADEPGVEPTSIDDGGGAGTAPGEGRNDEPAADAGTHRGW